MTYVETWLDRLYALVARYPGYGGADLALMSMAELWGLYRFLGGVADRASTC